MFKVVVTGPESTGKTEICQFLALSFRAKFIPEYAREYIASLGRPYTYGDVERIARVQIEQLREHSEGGWPILFLDTYLVITKVWFREVYGKTPDWIDEHLAKAGIDLYLLCYYDIEWTPDPVRENPDPRRAVLYAFYLDEIKRLGRPYEIIRGHGQERFNQAQAAVRKHFDVFKERT